MSGEVKLNLANYNGVGLLELNLSGENGVSLGLGMGGIDVSLGTIAGAMSGLRDSTKIIGAKVENLFGNNEKLSTLNVLNGLGYSRRVSDQELAKAVWEEEIKAAYKDLGYDDNGNKILGRYVGGEEGNRSNELLLDKMLLGGGREGSAKLAAVMSHENTHLKENRYEGIAHLAGLGTYSEINAIFGLEADSGFYGEMFAGILNPESWIANTGDVDNWKLTNDGKFINDKRSSLYRETSDGDEFIIWNLEDMSVEDSFNMIFTTNGDTTSLSREALIRIGLYEILNGASNLTEDKFKYIALNRYYGGDNLGYFIDFSMLKEDMKYLNTPTFSKANSIAMPSNEFIFNPKGSLYTSGVFGTLASAGFSFSVGDTPFFNDDKELIRKVPDNLPSNDFGKSVDSAKVVAPNPYGPSSGKPTTVIPVVNPLQGAVSRIEAGEGMANGLALLSNYFSGLQEGINVMSIGLPQWEFYGIKYFSLWQPELDRISSNTFYYEPRFISHYEVLTSSIARKIDTYLGMPDGIEKNLKLFWNNLVGW
jgi:hypothetical protein